MKAHRERIRHRRSAALRARALRLGPPSPGPELSVVAPTFNERANVERLVEKLAATLAGVAWEVIFVDDDSPDGTAALVKELAARDARVRCIRRVGRRGLAGAVIEGALASAAPYVAVIDADMQHDETLLPRMLAVLRAATPTSWSAAATSTRAGSMRACRRSARRAARSQPRWAAGR